MVRHFRNIVTIGALSLMPTVAFAAQAARQPAKPAQTAAKPAQTAAKPAVAEGHSVTGTVKSINATTLVLNRQGNAGEMAFTLGNSTKREGKIAAGSSVMVHYEDKGTTHMASAIMLEPPQKTASASTPASKTAPASPASKTAPRQ